MKSSATSFMMLTCDKDDTALDVVANANKTIPGAPHNGVAPASTGDNCKLESSTVRGCYSKRWFEPIMHFGHASHA